MHNANGSWQNTHRTSTCNYLLQNARVCPVKKYPRAKIEPPWDSLKACIKYTRKERTRILGPWSFGDEPKQGERKDLNVLRDRIMNGESVDDLMMENPATFHEYGRTLAKIEDLRMSKIVRTEMTQGMYLVGATGTGKSFRAKKGYDSSTHYYYPYDKGWWDNYKQQPIVVFNEFRGDNDVPFKTMLDLLDEGPCTVPRRNRAPMPFTSKLIIITSPLSPEKVYGRVDKDDNLDQFMRRINVIELTEKYTGKQKASLDDNKELFRSITGIEFD